MSQLESGGSGTSRPHFPPLCGALGRSFSPIARIMSGAMLTQAVKSKGFGHQIPDPPQHTLEAVRRLSRSPLTVLRTERMTALGRPGGEFVSLVLGPGPLHSSFRNRSLSEPFDALRSRVEGSFALGPSAHPRSPGPFTSASVETFAQFDR